MDQMEMLVMQGPTTLNGDELHDEVKLKEDP